MNKKRLIVLAGPTAVGKTALSVELAKHFNCPIISADSRQFYKEIGIGTAKPTIEEMDGVKHFFIDSHSIDTPVSAGQFEREAIPIIEELFKTHNLLILTGGSGLFLKAIYDGLDNFIDISESTKDRIDKLFEKNGIQVLQNELQKRDPDYFQKVDIHNPVRLSRALEVCIESGKTYSSFLNQKKDQRSFDIVKVMLNRDREELYQRINHRVDVMIENGLIEEVKSVYDKKDLKSLQTVGYQELFDFLDNKHSIETAINLIKRNSRRYAKRQLTWFKREGFEWFNPYQKENIINFIENS